MHVKSVYGNNDYFLNHNQNFVFIIQEFNLFFYSQVVYLFFCVRLGAGVGLGISIFA